MPLPNEREMVADTFDCDIWYISWVVKLCNTMLPGSSRNSIEANPVSIIRQIYTQGWSTACCLPNRALPTCHITATVWEQSNPYEYRHLTFDYHARKEEYEKQQLKY